MKLSQFDYNLPKDLIAQLPADKRDESRLMVLNRSTGKIEHKRFFEITEYLKSGDVLVLNDTRVIPARLYGKKRVPFGRGGSVEVFLLEQDSRLSTLDSQVWNCLIGNSKGIKPASEIEFDEDLKAKVIKKNADGSWCVELSVGQASRLSVEEAIDKIGIMPLPPYIKRVRGQGSRVKEIDKERYQTVFAKKDGAVAAPTAGLHFTNELLAKIKSVGVEIQYVTLHTGWGTFKPVKVDDVTKHKMPEEYYEVSNKVFESIKNAKKENRRIIAVGTTATRTLESMINPSQSPFDKGGLDSIPPLEKGGKGGFGWDNPMLQGHTNLFIYPGFNFKVVDAMITNFHLPKSTLLMLVCAFAGRDLIMKAYKTAIENKYRFFSYGDAMMIL